MWANVTMLKSRGLFVNIGQSHNSKVLGTIVSLNVNQESSGSGVGEIIFLLKFLVVTLRMTM